MRVKGPGDWGHFPSHVPTGASVTAEADNIISKYRGVMGAAETTEQEHSGLMSAIEGMITAAVTTALSQFRIRKSNVDDTSTFAAGCLRRFAERIGEYDRTKQDHPRSVTALNSEFETVSTSMFGLSSPDVEDMTPSEATTAQDEFLRKLRSRRHSAHAELEAEYDRLVEWMTQQSNDIARQLNEGPTRKNVRQLWRNGNLPSWAPTVYPDAGLDELAPHRIPYDLRSLSPAELMKYAGSVPWRTTSVHVEALARVYRLLSVGGDFDGTYTVNADGSIEIDINPSVLAGVAVMMGKGNAEAGAKVLGGSTAHVTLTFDNQAELDEFLDGLAEAADHGVLDLVDGFIPGPVGGVLDKVEDVADVISPVTLTPEVISVARYLYGNEHVSIQVGTTTRVAAEAGLPPIDLSGAARVDQLVDINTGALEEQFQYTGSLGLGPGTTASQLTGKLKWDPSEGSVDASFAFKLEGKLGEELPIGPAELNAHVDKGMTAHITVKDIQDNEALIEALSNGNIEQALKEAYDSGNVVLTDYTGADGGGEVKGPVSGTEGSIDHENTQRAWVKPPDTPYYIPVNDGTSDSLPD